MKASVSPCTMVLAGLLLAAGCALGQDTLVLANGQRREGEILAVVDGRVRFKAGPAEATIPLDQIASARMQPPPSFAAAEEALRVGDAAKALAELKPVVEKFRGLPASWIERASAMLGAVLLETGNVAGAEAAFAAFQAAYPKATGLADIGLARLAIEKKRFDEAATKLEPMIAAARKTLLAESGKSAEYGQALYLMGLVHESRGEYPEALESHLLAATIFDEDPAVAAKAQARADAIASEKKAAVP